MIYKLDILYIYKSNVKSTIFGVTGGERLVSLKNEDRSRIISGTKPFTL